MNSLPLVVINIGFIVLCVWLVGQDRFREIRVPIYLVALFNIVLHSYLSILTVDRSFRAKELGVDYFEVPMTTIDLLRESSNTQVVAALGLAVAIGAIGLTAYRARKWSTN